MAAEELKNLSRHFVHTELCNYFHSLHMELTNQVESSLLLEVLPSAHARSTPLANPECVLSCNCTFAVLRCSHSAGQIVNRTG